MIRNPAHSTIPLTLLTLLAVGCDDPDPERAGEPLRPGSSLDALALTSCEPGTHPRVLDPDIDPEVAKLPVPPLLLQPLDGCLLPGQLFGQRSEPPLQQLQCQRREPGAQGIAAGAQIVCRLR